MSGGSGATRRVSIAGRGGEELGLDVLLRELEFLSSEGVDLARVKYNIRTKGFMPMMIKEMEVEFDYDSQGREREREARDDAGHEPV